MTGMEIQIGIAKTSRFDRPFSQESFETTERPAGGETVVFCDGMSDGLKDKTWSAIFVNKTIGMIAEGHRDSIAIKTISNQIFHEQAGNVEGKLGVISADLSTRTVVTSRCMSTPVYYYQRGVLDEWVNGCRNVGSGKSVSPCVTEIPMEPGTLVVMLSDGAYYAGRDYQRQIDVPSLIQGVIDESSELNARIIADFILAQAIAYDQNKPMDDMSVIVMKIARCNPSHVRRMMFTVPIPDPDDEEFNNLVN